MTTRLLGTALALAALVQVQACSHSTSQNSASGVTSNAPAVVQVTNHNAQDVDVFLDRGGERQRLGMVTTGDTQTFNIPAHLLHGSNDLQVTVHPIGGGGDYRTDRVLVHPGETVEVVIAPLIDQSRMSVQQGEG